MPPMAKRGTSEKKPTLDANVRICVLYGADEMLKRLYLQQLRDAVTAAHGDAEAFNFDGKSASLSDVLDELRSYSLMQSYKLVVVDDADQFVKTNRAALDRYAEAPVDHATLVLRSTTWNKGNLDKKIAKVGAMVKCDEPSPDQAQRWLVRRAESEYGVKITNDAAQLLVERLGCQMMPLDTELGKLSLMVGRGESIQPALVREVVGRSSDEEAYMMQEAVLRGLQQRSAAPMLAKVRELVDLGNKPDVLVAYFVADVVRKLNVALLMQASGVPQGQVMKQLKVFGSRQRMFQQVLGRLDAKRAAGWFDQAVTADAHAKSGRGDTVRNLEALCVRLADEIR